ncbi:unnamed protein product [Psylliodes chrysocephalus]|uniref:Uncharacterized protein n=1 Tax=Psylliodes chrysocephalus TaxID=3402493 RepID=A0A9P0GHM8_9CUCU|nr:unnamed protein product [Psylliodes chrysocephala]
MMQSVTTDNKMCQNYSKNLVNNFKNYTDDNVFEEKLAQAGELAAALEIKQGFPPLNTVRRKYKPKLFDYEQRDEIPQDQKTAFKINFFLKIIDQTLSSLSSRFEMISDYDVFGFLSDIFKILSCSTAKAN